MTGTDILATYRLQLHAEFSLARARELVPYFERLGITHLHCSPVLQARRGSTHGYDVVDPTRLDPGLGTEADLAALVGDLRARGMGLVLDVVPNHMAASDENPAWEDVLARGRASPYARWFDIEWLPLERGARSRIVLPVLGDARARVLERDEIGLAAAGDTVRLRYWEHSFPLHPATVPMVLEHGVEAFGRGPEGRARIRRLLDAQVYRLVHWRRAARELNYRRFFDVNELVALRVEDPDVFAQTHALLLDWCRRGWVDGFRVDHLDGLLDPGGYLERLAAAFPQAGDAGPPAIFVEKILAPGERLRDAWPAAGTTGYDGLNEAEALFVHPAGWDALEREYRRVIRQPLDFAAIARAAKRYALETGLSAGVRRLAQQLRRLAGRRQPPLAVSVDALVAALVDTIAALPVYRTYVDERHPVPVGADRALLDAALAAARDQGRAGPAALELLAEVLLAADGASGGEDARPRLRLIQRFQQLSGPAMAKGVEDTAFYSYAPLLSRNEVGGGPAPPLEEAVARFHEGNLHRAKHWPRTLLAATTHDTKRSADARARLDVLSELSAAWEERFYRWRRWNRKHQRLVHGRQAPDANMVYHLYQALVAIWPLVEPDADCLASLRDRLGAYAVKAAREAKTRTSWTDPDEGFETALRAYVEALLTPAAAPEFLEDFAPFAARIGRLGLWNAFAKTLLQLTVPGVPDVYQGDELWNFALVDPDNRRPVDFALRRRLLEGLPREDQPADGLVDELVARADDGRLKLYLTARALAARKRYRELFLRGAYVPLAVEGALGRHLVAFARHSGATWAIVLAPRLLASLLADSGSWRDPGAPWADTAVRLFSGWPTRWRCVLTGAAVDAQEDGRLPVAEVLRHLPGALLIGEGGKRFSSPRWVRR